MPWNVLQVTKDAVAALFGLAGTPLSVDIHGVTQAPDSSSGGDGSGSSGGDGSGSGGGGEGGSSSSSSSDQHLVSVAVWRQVACRVYSTYSTHAQQQQLYWGANNSTCMLIAAVPQGSYHQVSSA
jgi:hypothetical protein